MLWLYLLTIAFYGWLDLHRVQGVGLAEDELSLQSGNLVYIHIATIIGRPIFNDCVFQTPGHPFLSGLNIIFP